MEPLWAVGFPGCNCDDFRRPVDGTAARRAVDRFCRGWHINSLLTSGELGAVAEAAGFAHASTRSLVARRCRRVSPTGG